MSEKKEKKREELKKNGDWLFLGHESVLIVAVAKSVTKKALDR